MVKGKRYSVNSLTALIDGLKVNAEPEQPKKKTPKKDPTDLLLGNLKKLDLTDKKQFKQPRSSRSKKSGISVSSSTGRVKMDISNTGKVNKKKVRLPRRTRSTRNADETLSSALDKLGLGTKKKRKKRRSKSKKKKRRKRRSKTKRN